MTGKLTAIAARALIKPGRYSDGGGLHLHIRNAARRAWVFRYTRNGKTRDMGLGPFPDVSLADTRKAAERARAELREGRDPVSARLRTSQAQSADQTFRAAAELYIETTKRPGAVRSTQRNGAPHLLLMALPWQQVSAFVAELQTVPGSAARALTFAILTAARTGEVRGARWHEIDLDAAVWTVPAGRMKARRLHRVPLSPPALALLRALLALRTGSDDLIFAGARSAQPLSDMAVSMVVRRMNSPPPENPPRSSQSPPRWCDVSRNAVVPHGFRSTFRVWAPVRSSHIGAVIVLVVILWAAAKLLGAG